MMYESDVFHHTYVSSCSSDKFYLIREDSLLQPNTRCYDVCMTHTLEIADIFRQLAGGRFWGPARNHPTFILLSLLFSFIYPTVSSGTQSIHSHAAKIEVIIQKILEMNTSRGDSRINEGEEEAEENKSEKMGKKVRSRNRTERRNLIYIEEDGNGKYY